MGDFWFYIQMGLEHVLDLNAYDHILFLTALAVPFTFANWKKVLILATIFTIAHCFSLALSVYGIVEVDVALIEFLIPVTILFTAIHNLFHFNKPAEQRNIVRGRGKNFPLVGFCSGDRIFPNINFTGGFVRQLCCYFFHWG